MCLWGPPQEHTKNIKVIENMYVKCIVFLSRFFNDFICLKKKQFCDFIVINQKTASYTRQFCNKNVECIKRFADLLFRNRKIADFLQCVGPQGSNFLCVFDPWVSKRCKKSALLQFRNSRSANMLIFYSVLGLKGQISHAFLTLEIQNAVKNQHFCNSAIPEVQNCWFFISV